jgi:hypothetical protein
LVRKTTTSLYFALNFAGSKAYFLGKKIIPKLAISVKAMKANDQMTP